MNGLLFKKKASAWYSIVLWLWKQLVQCGLFISCYSFLCNLRKAMVVPLLDMPLLCVQFYFCCFLFYCYEDFLYYFVFLLLYDKHWRLDHVH